MITIKGHGKRHKGRSHCVINIPIGQGAKRKCHGTGGDRDMETITIEAEEGMREVVMGDWKEMNIQYAAVVTILKYMECDGKGRQPTGSNYVNISGTLPPPQTAARCCRTLGRRILRPTVTLVIGGPLSLRHGCEERERGRGRMPHRLMTSPSGVVLDWRCRRRIEVHKGVMPPRCQERS